MKLIKFETVKVRDMIIKSVRLHEHLSDVIRETTLLIYDFVGNSIHWAYPNWCIGSRPSYILRPRDGLGINT